MNIFFSLLNGFVWYQNTQVSVQNMNLRSYFFDPRISPIDKILTKFCPEFLDLYASIYGKYFIREVTNIQTYEIYYLNFF